MTTPREIELKLELDPAGRSQGGVRTPRWLRAALPAGGRTRRLVSRYFDTADRALHRAGYALRIRHDGERRIQTLKALRPGHLLERSEWESPVADDGPDLTAISDPERRDEIAAFGALLPVFETRIERTTWQVARGRSRIEIALDTGQVTDGARSEAIREVELELKAGSPATLFRLARDLAAAGPVRIGMRSKSARGYGLAEDRFAPVKAEKVRLDPDATAAEAFQAIARGCIRHFLLNEPGVVDGRVVECLHQARVALRRLRSAFGLFREAIGGPEAERLTRELRIVSAALGEARNLDVYLERKLAAEAERHPDEPGLADLRARIEGERERAYDRVARRLGAKRFRLAALDLLAFVEAGDWLRDAALASRRDEPATLFAARMLRRRRRKVRRGGRHLARLDPAARHEVRIAAKKLRYASEFFASLFSAKRKRIRAFVAALEDLQSCLGDLNDIATGHAMALAMARDTGVVTPALLFAAGHVSGAAEAGETALVASAAEAHRALRKAKAFW